jgi:hypothetical protein
MALQIFIEAGCYGCLRAQEIAAEMVRRFPALSIKLVDIGEEDDVPESVFAVPTYQLDGKTVFLGNPAVEELATLLTNLTQTGLAS